MDLKELLGEELFNQVKEKTGEHKIAIVSDGSYIPKDKFDDKLNEVKDLKAEIKQRDEQIGKLKDSAKGNEDLEEKINKLQQANDDWQNKYKQTQLETAIKLAAKGAKDPSDILAFVKRDGLELQEDGTVKGLEEALTGLKESKPYLFEEGGLKGRKPIETDDNPPPLNKNPFSKEHFNLTEQGRLFREDPELYKKLKAQA